MSSTAVDTSPALQRPPRVEALTGLRFVAAAIVLIEHFPQIIPGLSDYQLSQGGAGVSMFFVLSGFVLVLNYGDRMADGLGRGSLRRYATARAARLLPLHLCALAIVAVLVLWRTDPIGVHGLVPVAIGLAANVFLIHAWVPAQVFDLWNGPAWSISAEAFFYVMLPLAVPRLVWPVLRRRWFGRAIIGIIAIEIGAYFAVSYAAGWLLLSRGGNVESTGLVVTRLARFPPIRLGEFIVGCLLAAAFRPESRAAARGVWALLEQRRVRTTLLAGAVAATIAIQFTPTCVGSACGPEATTALSFIDLRSFAVYVPVMAVVVAAVAWGDSAPATFLRHPLMIRLGEASYALYIVQWSAWLVVNDRAVGPPGPALAASAIFGSIGVALLAHRWIETPARRWVLARSGVRHRAEPPQDAASSTS